MKVEESKWFLFFSLYVLESDEMLVFLCICGTEYCWVYESDCSVTGGACMQHVSYHSSHPVERADMYSNPI